MRLANHDHMVKAFVLGSIRSAARLIDLPRRGWSNGSSWIPMARNRRVTMRRRCDLIADQIARLIPGKCWEPTCDPFRGRVHCDVDLNPGPGVRDAR